MCCYTLNLSLKCTHISVSHVLVVASHQTFRENISGNIYYWWFKKILVLRSVDIFYFLYQTICQKYKVLLILDKIPDKTILWQLQCSNKSNAQDRLPTLSSRLSQPLWMLLSCFSSGVRAEFISRDSLTVFCFWFFVFFCAEPLRVRFDSANSGWCVCRLCSFEQMGQHESVWRLQLNNAV